MTKLGKISTIKKENKSTTASMENSLSKQGLTRMPGTGVYIFPYKEIDGTYRTGLDPDATYIKRIQNEEERNLEKKRVVDLKRKLQGAFGDIDLTKKSDFWNYSKSKGSEDKAHIQAVKLNDGDNLFDFKNPWSELTFSWLRVHPTIASSYQAWERGEYPATTKFYVVDDEIETSTVFKKKTLINKAIGKFVDMTPSTRKKVARQLGLPISEDAKEETVYNLIDNFLKQSELKAGKFVGQDPVKVFNSFADMKEQLLHVKDLVKQGLDQSVIRVKNGGKLYKGEYELAKSEEDYVAFLMDDNNQEELLTLEQDLKSKKLAAV